MTVDEFDDWLRELLDAFPGMKAWIASFDSPERTLEVWRGVLSDVDASDASEVVRLMACGDIEPPAAYDRDRTAGIVRKHARKMSASRKSEAIAEAERRENTRTGRCQPIGPILRRAMEAGAALRAGEITPEQHATTMEEIKRIAGSDPNAFVPRYFCQLCQDRGTVIVWAPHVVMEVKRTGQPPRRRATCVVACNCARGHRWRDPPQIGNYRPRGLPAYDEAHYCVTSSGTPTASEVGEFMEWVSGFTPRPANYENAFAEYETTDDPFL